MQDGFTKQVSVNDCEYGLGLFAEQVIHEGELYWEAREGENVISMSRAQYCCFRNSELAASRSSKNMLDTLTTFSMYTATTDSLMCIMDNSRYINHDTECANGRGTEAGSYALRDIEKGEQIFENYSLYAPYVWPEPWDDFGESFMVDLKGREEYSQSHPANPLPPSIFETTLAPVLESHGRRGLYLISTKHVPAGTLVWERNASNLLSFPLTAWKTLAKSEISKSKMSSELLAGLSTFGYYCDKADAVILSLDNTRFVQHESRSPSLVSDSEGRYFTTKAIRPGQELTSDFSKLPSCPFAYFTWQDYLF